MTQIEEERGRERVAHDNWTREWMWRGGGRPERRDGRVDRSGGWMGESRVGGEGAEVSFNDRRVRLTVGHTLILDLQVFVGSWAGVREDV